MSEITLSYDLLHKIPYRRGNEVDPLIIFVGQAAGGHEFADDHIPKRAFIGYSGKLLDTKLIANAKIDPRTCYFTNVIKERVPDGKDEKWIKENPQAYQTYLKLLEAELNLVAKHANIIVPLGNVALKAVAGKKGIQNWRGSIISSTIIRRKDGSPLKCVPALHPASILRTWSELTYTKIDFMRIAEEAKTAGIVLPQRKHVIKPDFDTAIFYLNKYINSLFKISCDTETLKNIRPNRIVSIQFADNKDEGFCLPLCHKNGMSWWSPERELILWRMIYRILTEKQAQDNAPKLIGQNFTVFDAFMTHFHGISYRKVLDNIHIDLCEAIKCREPELPASLAFLTSVYTREPFYKDEGKVWTGKQDEDTFFTYGCKDVEIPCEIAPQLEQDLKDEGLWEKYKRDFLDMAIPRMELSTNGLHIDLKKREELNVEFSSEIVKEQCKLTVLAGKNVNVKSTPDMRGLLYETMKLPKQYTKEGKLTTNEDALLKLSTLSDSPIFPIILKLRHLRTLKSNTIDARLDSDNKIRSSFGWTETHRLTSSSTPFQTGQNLQNWDKKMRAMVSAPPGYVLGKGDLSQAEARIVAWKGRMIKSIRLFLDPNKDIHYETAAEVAGRKIIEDAKTLKERYVNILDIERYNAKRLRYGINYDIHPPKFAITYNKDASKLGLPLLTIAKAAFLIDRFHKIEPDLELIYHEEIKHTVSNTMTLLNFFGGRMRFHERIGDDLFRAAYSWYAQSTVAYLINIIWKKALAAGIRIIHQNHDELCWLSKIGEELKDAAIMWNLSRVPMDICGLKDVPPLIIPFEIEIGKNWYDTKKVKIEELEGVAA